MVKIQHNISVKYSMNIYLYIGQNDTLASTGRNLSIKARVYRYNLIISYQKTILDNILRCNLIYLYLYSRISFT